jgi:hypothetical protein
MKKLLLTLALCALMCALFVIGASAATTVTDDGSNVTLGNCTIANLDGVTIPSVTRGLVYSLDDETMTAAVSGKGSFKGGEGVSLVFPSSVTYNKKTYKVTQINAKLFQSLTYDLYIPDSVKFIDENAFMFCPNLTIKCYENSYAHKYCINHKISWKTVPMGMDLYNSVIF